MIIKKVLLAIFLSSLVILGSWYLRSQTAKNIVTGVVKDPHLSLKSTSGQTNILLLGMGGEGHEGGDLTDSILFVSLSLDKPVASVIPIPRDIWVTSMEAKINTAYHYGNERRSGGGLALAKSAVAETLGVPVHYAVALDFGGFVKAIDAVGGIDVTIDRTFDDYKYPIPGKETAIPESDRYEHLHFEAGPMHMDGATALKFARSRHALGDEGTDFARGSRQAKIIEAFKNKVLSLDTLFSSTKFNDLKNSLLTSIDTDISTVEQSALFRVILALGNQSNVKNIAIQEYLITPKNLKPYAGQWVLLPNPSLDKLHEYVSQKLAN